MTEPVAAPAPPKAAPTVTDLDGTEYVILTKSGAMWEQGKTRTARSAEAAIRDHVSDKNAVIEPEGTYLAIPARSFKPVTVKVQTTTTLKLEAS